MYGHPFCLFGYDSNSGTRATSLCSSASCMCISSSDWGMLVTVSIAIGCLPAVSLWLDCACGRQVCLLSRYKRCYRSIGCSASSNEWGVFQTARLRNN
jgi:hypothetical protein